MVSGDPGNLLAGAPAPLGVANVPVYGLACSLFTLMMLFASRRLGYPSESAVVAAAAQGVTRSSL